MQNNRHLRLGVNIDHVATLRNARGGDVPCPIKAAKQAINVGADSITAHLREDRRHIKDDDIAALMQQDFYLNLEMAATDEMQKIALHHKPHAICLVPEKRQELTTEGGLNVLDQKEKLKQFIEPLAAHSRVSLFIDPDLKQIDAAKEAKAAVVELHTGQYAEHTDNAAELKRIQKAATHAAAIGLEVHAGHGLNFKNVAAIADIPEIIELNIGHYIIAQAVFMGLENAVREMRRYMTERYEN